MLSPHIRYSDKTKNPKKIPTRTRTPDTASSRILEDAWLHLSPENRSEYRELSSIFEHRSAAKQSRSLHGGYEKPHAISMYCEASQYGNYLTPPRNEDPVTSNKNTRKSSLDLTTQSFFECDEPELQHDPLVLSVQDTITEISVSPPQFAFKLYISGLKAANDMSILKEHDIGAILSLGTSNIPSHYNFIQAYTSLAFPNIEHNIHSDLNKALHFLEYELDRHNVLVHCYHGVNRSIAVVAGYLIKLLHISASKAIDILTAARQVTRVSGWLMSQLESLRWTTAHYE